MGAIGAEDLGHKRGDDWGGPGQAKTVLVADDRSPAAIQAALRARRFYAIATPAQRLSYTVDGAQMRSRLTVRAGQALRFVAKAVGAGLELVTNGGDVAARAPDGRLSVRLPAARGAHWYFVRATRAGKVVYSSLVWVAS